MYTTMVIQTSKEQKEKSFKCDKLNNLDAPNTHRIFIIMIRRWSSQQAFANCRSVIFRPRHAHSSHTKYFTATRSKYAQKKLIYYYCQFNRKSWVSKLLRSSKSEPKREREWAIMEFWIIVNNRFSNLHQTRPNASSSMGYRTCEHDSFRIWFENVN